MPFDGKLALPGTPPDHLLNAAHALEAERRATRKAALSPLTPEGANEQQRQRALKSVAVLDRLEALLAGGRCWTRGQLTDGEGRYCLLGGIEHIRKASGNGDQAGVYLRRVITRQGGGGNIACFNDRQISYMPIAAAIVCARELALAEVTRSRNVVSADLSADLQGRRSIRIRDHAS